MLEALIAEACSEIDQRSHTIPSPLPRWLGPDVRPARRDGAGTAGALPREGADPHLSGMDPVGLALQGLHGPDIIDSGAQDGRSSSTYSL